jgi:acetyl-CoA carboxylase biotin carboxyl carrier protein
MTDEPKEDLLQAIAREAHALAGRLPGPLRRLRVVAGDHVVEVEWDRRPAAPGAPAAAGAVVTTTTADGDVAVDVAKGHPVVAPLVGTFYRSPEPGSKPFVEVGDTVEADSEVAIVEAMKIMNRITADCAGRITEILVADGEMVEFGQTLMYVEASED